MAKQCTQTTQAAELRVELCTSEEYPPSSAAVFIASLFVFFAKCASLPFDPMFSEDVVEKLITDLCPVDGLSSSGDGTWLMKLMSGQSDSVCARVLKNLRDVTGFRDLLHTPYGCYASILHLACVEELPNTVEVLMEFYSGEAINNCIINNGIAHAPLLHWLLAKWTPLTDPNGPRSKIIASLLDKEGVNIHQVYSMPVLGDKKVMELITDKDLPSVEENEDAKRQFLFLMRVV